MQQTIRFKTFETNSSTYHSCCILTDEEYKQYKSGNMYLSKYGDSQLVTKESIIKEFEDQYFDDYFQDWLVENSNKVLDENNQDKYAFYDEKLRTLDEAKEFYREESMDDDLCDYMRDNGYESIDSDSNYEQDHTTREINGTTIHVLCDYGYDY